MLSDDIFLGTYSGWFAIQHSNNTIMWTILETFDKIFYDLNLILLAINMDEVVSLLEQEPAPPSYTFDPFLLHFRNSCQHHLHLCLSCDYLSTNSVPRCTTVDYHIIFIPLFTWTFLRDSLSYSQVLPYVTTIRSSSVDINSDSLLFISTLDFAFQGMGMHRTIFIIYHMYIPCLRNSL